MALLADRRTAGDPDPAEIITVTFGGMTFRCGRRTYAHLLWTQEQLDRVHPGAWIRVIQSCFHDGELSAGTHDGDGVLDVEIVGWDDWLAEQGFLRDCGWADFWRHFGTWADPDDWHHHMVSLGCPGEVGEFVPGQVYDYGRRALGLKGQHDSGDDPTYHPDPQLVFDYPGWLISQEDYMSSDAAERKLDQILRQTQATRKLAKGLAQQVDVMADAVALGAQVGDDIKGRIAKASRELKALIAELGDDE